MFLNKKTFFIKFLIILIFLQSCATEYLELETSKEKLINYEVQHHPSITEYTLLDSCNKSNSSIVIDLIYQRIFLISKNKVVLHSHISTGRYGKSTPVGNYRISEKVRKGKISTIYNVEMPYWMRLNKTPIGIHSGYLPGYPDSSGCIRLSYNIAEIIFNKVKVGTRVKIYQEWERSYDILN